MVHKKDFKQHYMNERNEHKQANKIEFICLFMILTYSKIQYINFLHSIIYQHVFLLE